MVGAYLDSWTSETAPEFETTDQTTQETDFEKQELKEAAEPCHNFMEESFAKLGPEESDVIMEEGTSNPKHKVHKQSNFMKTPRIFLPPLPPPHHPRHSP
jgi:hypothetical protein